ncbi:biotin/lipoyl-containing protein, partial [Streptomyces sp. NPDC057496]|uniref:biotin/lipoyl-containing protein n=1 Tax=Streptomyces sp. NPDC057496 TaxID=3346149 RepID=UPI0036BD82ED
TVEVGAKLATISGPVTPPPVRGSARGTAVTLPSLGESVTEGTVTRWLKRVGESVTEDEPLLEVSTDKVDTEIPSPISGTLLEILVAEDETVEVGAKLATISGPVTPPPVRGSARGTAVTLPTPPGGRDGLTWEKPEEAAELEDWAQEIELRLKQKGPVFEYIASCYDDPVLRDDQNHRELGSIGITALIALFVWLTGNAPEYQDFAIVFGGIGFTIYGLWYLNDWIARRDLKGEDNVQPRELRVDSDGVFFEDRSGPQRIPWAAIQEVAIRYTDAAVSQHHLLALHLRLERSQLEVPATVYRPAGWPLHAELPATCQAGDDWMPVCVLGSPETPHQVDLKNTIATYAGLPLQVEAEATGW